MSRDLLPLAAPTRGHAPDRTLVALLFATFFVSGACGLIHEVVWTRLLRHVMGNTTWSITTVLCVFLGGLALGGWLGGRVVARRHDPIRVFAFLEIGIGLYTLLLPTLVDGLEPIYRSFYQGTTSSFAFGAVRFAFSGVVLLPAALLMGATLPVLSRFVVRSSDAIGGAAGRLYGVNTLGAVLGAAGAGLLLIPAIGTLASMRAASFLNLAIGGVALLLHRRAAGSVADAGEVDDAGEVEPNPLRSLVWITYGVSGAAALIYEVAWTRALSLMIGSSVYAFSMILAAFILGLGVGSVVGARYADRTEHPARLFAYLELLVAGTALLVVPLIDVLPLRVTGWFATSGDSFSSLLAVQFLVVLMVTALPTLLMGALFPVVNRVAAGGAASRSIGSVYAVNTVGSIVGAFAAGFLLIPSIGIQNTIYVAVAMNLAIAAAVRLRCRGAAWPRARVFEALGVVCLALIVFLPRWDASKMSFGPFMNARRLSREAATSVARLEEIVEKGKILYYEEGLSTTVSVTEYAATPDRPYVERILAVNGKPDASSITDLSTQQLLAHVPMMLQPEPEDVLVIGLASGITLASCGRHESVRRLDCAEIAPAVVEACRYFDEQNGAILDDPRVRILQTDGRNHVALTDQTYDVIISEPSNPWIAGIGDLFTLEFFEACRERLNDGGVVCIWVETYNIDRASLKSIARTFLTVFPSASLWNSTTFDFQLIGVKGDLRVDVERFRRRLGAAAVAADLKRIDIESPERFLSHQVMGPVGLDRFAGHAPLQTDDDASLEFAAPRLLVKNVGDLALLEEIEDHRAAEYGYFVGEPDAVSRMQVKAEHASRVHQNAARAQIHVLRANRFGEEGKGIEALEELKRAAALDPSNPVVVKQIEEGLKTGEQMKGAGRVADAIGIYRSVLAMDGKSIIAHADLARILAMHPDARFRSGAQAVEHAERANAIAGNDDPELLDVLAAAYAEAGRFDDARITASRALSSAKKTKNAALVKRVEAHLAAFEKNQAVREP